MRTGKPASPLIRGLWSRWCTSSYTEETYGCLATGGEVLACPLAATGRRYGRRHDMLERVVGAHTTVVTRCPPAVGQSVFGERRLPVEPEEVPVQSRRDV